MSNSITNKPADASTPTTQRKRERHVGIMVVHGIGVNDLTYSTSFMEGVMDRLWKSERRRIHWQPVFWADVIRPHQLGYMQRARGMTSLRYPRLRRFVLSALADAASYSKVGDPNESVYLDIQAKLARAVRHLKDDEDLDRPLIIVAHSLGCHIVSSYIHDTWSRRTKARDRLNRLAAGTPEEEIQAEYDKRGYTSADLEKLTRSEEQLDRDRFDDMQSLCGLVMLGCNIPVFTFRYHPFQIRPIAFPCKDLDSPVETPAHFQGRVEWLNFYSPFDPLGFPLKPLSSAYEKRVTEDIPVWAGTGLGFLTPYSHGGYWTHRKVLGSVVKMVRRLLEA